MNKHASFGHFVKSAAKLSRYNFDEKNFLRLKIIVKGSILLYRMVLLKSPRWRPRISQCSRKSHLSKHLYSQKKVMLLPFVANVPYSGGLKSVLTNLSSVL